MATYDQWNEHLLNYITSGIPRGTRVYVAIDDEVIEYIASQLSTTPSDFAASVRLKCVRNNSIDLHRVFIPGTSSDQYKNKPRYLAFLCAMVLAAYRMGEGIDMGIASNDYFYYFNSLLGLDSEYGRPRGMEHGTEEAIWKDWNIWLKYNGYQPTASKTGDYYYTYALSQALLRQSDKNNLWKFFSNNQSKYPETISKDELLQRLGSDINYGLTNHLKELIRKDGRIGTQRYDDLADAIYENFEAWLASGKQSERTRAFRTISRDSITSGLYRAEDFISRQPQYFLLPKQPRYIQLSEITASHGTFTESLLGERPGWYAPLPWELTIEDIENGLVLPISGSSLIRNLVLPKRDFWILSPDPDDIASGEFASWNEQPEIGIPFVLLAKSALDTDLNWLKNEGLLEWTSPPKIIGNWKEYADMVVISDAWGDVSIENKKLQSQLHPRSSISLSLQGGLRDPHSNAWIVDHGPDILVNSFYSDIEIEIFRTAEDDAQDHFDLKPGILTSYDWNSPGSYRLRVTSGEDALERTITIIDWSSISLSNPDKYQPQKIGSTTIFGAWMEEA